MWTLECEGPLFDRKRLWLRPGTSHLFGRTKQDTLRNSESYVLDAKSVSKKHLKLEVSAVRAGTGSQLHTRSELTIEDFSKLGTTIDGERISQSTKALSGDRHVITVAKYEHKLILQWRPVVFTIVNLTRTEKGSADPLANYRAQLESIDIKFTRDFVSGQTTHVVAEKRNIPAVLQGLIQGRHVVTKDYISRVVEAATEVTSPGGEGEPKAPLEKDFDGSWPDPMRFVPPVANEPIRRDAKLLAPNTQRADIFYGFTFVFCLKTQFDQLQPVINAGSGKAVLFEKFEEGKTDPKDFVAFVKNVAGEKGTGELNDSSQNKGVVVVRLATKNVAWDTHFVQESDRQLNQRSLEQNEFLDTILMVNTGGLRKRLAEQIDLESTERPTTSNVPRPVTSQQPEESHSAVSKSEPPSQAARRTKTESRFKGFDAFDSDEDDEAEPDTTAASGAVTRSMPQIRQDVSMEDAQNLPSSAPSRGTRLTAVSNTRKRPTPEPTQGDILDEILPAQAAMKRRRLNQNSASHEKTPEPEKQPVRRTRKEREVDLLAEVQKRREEEEARAREDAEKLKEAMDGMDIIGPANLVEIEEMQLSRSHSASISRTSHATARSERWDERWNDRPNFKRFKRKGEDRGTGVRRRNFVPLEEAKRKDFGIGEEYWLESGSVPKGKEQSQRETQVQTQTQTMREDVPIQVIVSDDEEEEGDGTQFRRRGGRAGKGSASQAVLGDDDNVQIVEESARTGRSETQHSTMQTRKRPARDPPATEPPAKKPTRTTRRKMDSDSENDDELAFPRRRGAAARRR